MDSFSIIQNFFTRMRCNFCSAYLEPEGIQLVREEQGVYVVNIECVHCSRQMGVAMVGLEGVPAQSESLARQTPRKYRDPELSEADLERLSPFAPISYDDVLEAHTFFENLGSDWQRHLPEEMRQLEIEPETESEETEEV